MGSWRYTKNKIVDSIGGARIIVACGVVSLYPTHYRGGDAIQKKISDRLRIFPSRSRLAHDREMVKSSNF